MEQQDEDQLNLWKKNALPIKLDADFFFEAARKMKAAIRGELAIKEIGIKDIIQVPDNKNE